MPDVPFWIRLLVLLATLATVAAVERYRRGAAATRWHEYSALLGAGVLGAVFGACFDQISFAISPDYFLYGKGIEDGPGFRLRVTTLGAQAGFVAGLVGGGALLMANSPTPERPALGYGRLARRVTWVMACALLLAPVGAASLPPFEQSLDVAWIPASVRPGFLRVWGLHWGLYGGALLGVVLAVVSVRRARGTREPSAIAAKDSGSAEA